jgi:hypothetical protein
MMRRSWMPEPTVLAWAGFLATWLAWFFVVSVGLFKVVHGLCRAAWP